MMWNRKKTQEDVSKVAIESANQAVRGELLDGVLHSYFADRLADITGASIQTLKREWAPFEPDIIAQSGFGVRLRTTDSLVYQLLIDEDLYQEAYDIAVKAYVDAMIRSDKTKAFLSTLIEDLILSDDPFYKAEAK